MNHSILQTAKIVLIYRYRVFQRVFKPILKKEGSKDGLSKTSENINPSKMKQGIETEAIQTNRKNRQICRKRRLRKMMEPAHLGK